MIISLIDHPSNSIWKKVDSFDEMFELFQSYSFKVIVEARVCIVDISHSSMQW